MAALPSCRGRRTVAPMRATNPRLAVPPGSISDQTTTPIPHSLVRRAVDLILATTPQALDRAEVTAGVLQDLTDPISDLRELGVRLGAVIETVGASV